VAIAIALANRPRLLLADEPSGELDSATALTVYETFQTLNHELGITTLIVSHDPELARHVDRVVTIRDGLLASETVRPSRARRGAVTRDADDPSDAFEELTVVDSAGRLQVSRELLARFDIKGRVRLEPASEGILIRPALDVDHAENTEILANDMAQSQRAKRARWWVGRLRRDRKEQE
jgi:ABC-type multidrug transport system ATPase subunit